MTDPSTSRLVYVIKLESLYGDSIKHLRFVLKALLRTYGFRCLNAYEIRPRTISTPGCSIPDNSQKKEI